MKNKIHSLTRTHLNYVLLQGNTLQQISKISDELKKGLEVKIAAEFNTPLQLENSIVVGKAFNCENLTYETPAGFTLDQLKNLLIVNGTPQSKQVLIEKIVLELIRTNQSAIVFDFEGKYSRIIKMLEGTQFEDKVLHFQLGRTFRVDLLTSDIPYDKNNTDYLKYMLDAYALAYKKSERNIESFKNTLRNNANFDTQTMSLMLDADKERNVWDKDYENVEILTFMKEFAQNTISITGGDKIVGEIRPIDFLQSDKTIIADLSTLVELDHKVFITFVILSKLVHFLREGNTFLPKYLIVPKVDLFFEANYLDRTVHYGKVDKYLNPLLEHGMGLIFLANHVRYLHSNVFNFFSNYVAFRTFDKRDIASLMNIMNLQELHGSGYYGSTRNNTYQIDFLRNMTKGESIVKRSDIYQPYPMIIENTLEDLEKMSKEEIFVYMKRQGYDLKNTEKKLLESTKETLLEKDLGDFYALRKEIVRYLDALGTLDSVGNLYKRKVKEELLKAIYPRLSKRTKDRHTIKRIRDDLFELLLTQGYLVEKHPKRASGSEALIPSYGVGPQFELALRDYYETKKVHMDAQVVQEEGTKKEGALDSFTGDIPVDSTPKKILDEIKFRDVLGKKTGEVIVRAMMEMKQKLSKQDYEGVLKMAPETIKQFLIKVSKEILDYESKDKVDLENLDVAVKILSRSEVFPFTKEEIFGLLKEYSVKEESLDVRDQANELYDQFSQFYFRIYQKLQQKKRKMSAWVRYWKDI